MGTCTRKVFLPATTLGKVYGIVAECINARAAVALFGISNGGCRLTSKRVLLLLAP